MTSEPEAGCSIGSAIRELLTEKQLQAMLARDFASIRMQGRQKELARLIKLPSVLSQKLISGAMIASGFLPDTTAPQTIHPRFFTDALANMSADTVEAHGVKYSGVWVTAPDLSSAEDASLPVAPALPESGKRSGPEPRHGDEFIQEMLRFALRPDGFESLLELEQHMKDWCSTNQGDIAPSGRAIERWVRRYCPPELPTK